MTTMATTGTEVNFKWFYVRILLSRQRTIGYMLKVHAARTSLSVSLVERKRLLKSDGGIGVWVIPDWMLTEPQHENLYAMESKHIKSADILFLKDARVT